MKANQTPSTQRTEYIRLIMEAQSDSVWSLKKSQEIAQEVNGIRDMHWTELWYDMATSTTAEEETDIEKVITKVVREADSIFEHTGGSTRHYVRDVFLPLLRKEGVVIRRLPLTTASTPL